MIELLASRGHSLKALLDEYPISTVLALSKAAQVNRTYDLMSSANSIAVGAVHAIEAGFSGKQPKALRGYIDRLNRQVKKIQAKGQGTKDDAQALFSGFAGTAVMEKTNGRRKNQPRGSA
jgi:hypothetical protein